MSNYHLLSDYCILELYLIWGLRETLLAEGIIRPIWVKKLKLNKIEIELFT